MRLVHRLLCWLRLHRLPFGPEVVYLDVNEFHTVWKCRYCGREMRRREYRRRVS